jgi:general secretion pathway protein G
MVGILASTALPVSRNFVTYEKEKLLNERLREMRSAIDRFYQLKAAGENDLPDADCYPRDFAELIEKRFLRKIPLDPVTGEADWRTISSTDSPEAQISDGRNLFDVRSKSTKVGSNDIPYADW